MKTEKENVVKKLCRRHPGMWRANISGNPKGRPPKEKCIPDNLNKIGDEIAPKTIIDELRVIDPRLPTYITNRKAYLLRAYYDAARGDSSARDFIAERTEGKVKQVIDLGFDANSVQLKLDLTAENSPEPRPCKDGSN
jgi:hypothetical protein